MVKEEIKKEVKEEFTSKRSPKKGITGEIYTGNNKNKSNKENEWYDNLGFDNNNNNSNSNNEREFDMTEYKQEEGCGEDYYDSGSDNGSDDDSYEDPYENLTVDELKNRLPPYLFMDEEEKKVYLKELSENYVKEINSAKLMPKKKKKILKVKFDLKRNETHYFDKTVKISQCNQKSNEKKNQVKKIINSHDAKNAKK